MGRQNSLKMKKHFYLLLFTILAFSCNKEDDPSPIKNDGQITVFTNPDYSSFKDENWEGWVVIQSLDGSFLEMKELVKGGNVKFEGLENESYHLTFFDKTLRTYGGKPFTKLDGKAFLNVPVGKIYTHGLVITETSTANNEGEFKIFVSNSSPIGLAGGYSSGLNNSFKLMLPSPNRLELVQNFRSESSEYLVITYDYEGNHRYGFLSDVEVGKEYDFEYSEMSLFDHSITVPKEFFTDINIWVNSLNVANNKYEIGHVFNRISTVFNSNLGKYQVNFLDRFEKYSVLINIDKDDLRLVYNRVGSAPSKIEFPDNLNFSGQNLKASNFHVELPSWATNFNTRMDKQFLNQEGDYLFSLIVEGNQGDFTLIIPEELKSKYEFLEDFENFEFSSVTAKKSSYGYHEMIENVLIEEPVLFDFETYSVRKTFE